MSDKTCQTCGGTGEVGFAYPEDTASRNCPDCTTKGEEIRDAFVKFWKEEHCNFKAMSKPDSIFAFKAGYTAQSVKLKQQAEEIDRLNIAVDEEMRHVERYIDENKTLSSLLSEAVEVLKEASNEIWRNTCTHSETHRGGALWEICDICGCQWADDEGGKPNFKEPKAITEIDQLLKKLSQCTKESI